MGRIGRSYPRFEEAPQRAGSPSEGEGISAAQVTGAIVGVLCALGFISWLLSR
jgi:hypothetical protein